MPACSRRPRTSSCERSLPWVVNADRLTAFSREELAQVRSEFDTSGPKTRAWDYYAALAEQRL